MCAPICVMQGDRGFDGLPGLPGEKGNRVSGKQLYIIIMCYLLLILLLLLMHFASMLLLNFAFCVQIIQEPTGSITQFKKVFCF